MGYTEVKAVYAAIVLISVFNRIDLLSAEQLADGANESPVVDSLNKKGSDLSLTQVLINGPAGPGGKTTDEVSQNFVHAFVASLSMILVSELGDKTFFLAAIMAMKYSRTTVFAGAIAALGLMHIMSALFGYAAVLIPRMITYYASSALFFIFGLRMLREGWHMSPDEAKEELEETQAELKKYEDDLSTTQDPETGIIRNAPTRWFRRWRMLRCVSPIFLEAATLNFLAEWGDRSQITAIVLAARENVLGVIIGGLVGHCFCTGLAVLGGRLVAQHLSIRTVTLIGGVVFLIFAVSVFFIPPT